MRHKFQKEGNMGILNSRHGEALIWAMAVVILFGLLIGGIVGYHAFDRIYMEYYTVGIESNVEESYTQYHIDHTMDRCKVELEEGAIDIFCYP